MYAFKQNQDKCSPRQLRHLDVISQYSIDIRHVQGSQNVVANSLSRKEINSITKSSFLNFSEPAECQMNNPETQKFLKDKSSSLQLALKAYPSSDSELICDTSIGLPQPFVPKWFRKLIFDQLHKISHPGIAAQRN
ncbi:integrase_H2C2 domain-containing protein [Trichonephila clavipes]|nr:integrase_H2C2 domain-containing protein [Trichonephila clavipes]